eukprot:ANDGO_03614.mRNA.1 hypothetical protein
MPSERPAKRVKLAASKEEPESESGSEDVSESGSEEVMQASPPSAEEVFFKAQIMGLLLRRVQIERSKDAKALEKLRKDTESLRDKYISKEDADKLEEFNSSVEDVGQSIGELDEDDIAELESNAEGIRIVLWAASVLPKYESSAATPAKSTSSSPSLLEKYDAAQALKDLETAVKKGVDAWTIRSTEDLDSAFGYARIWRDRMYLERLIAMGVNGDSDDAEQEEYTRPTAVEFQEMLEDVEDFPASELQNDKSDLSINGKKPEDLEKDEVVRLFLAAESRGNILQFLMFGVIEDMQFALGDGDFVIEDDDDDEEDGDDNEDEDDDNEDEDEDAEDEE